MPRAVAYPGRRFALPWAIPLCPFGAWGLKTAERNFQVGGSAEDLVFDGGLKNSHEFEVAKAGLEPATHGL